MEPFRDVSILFNTLLCNSESREMLKYIFIFIMNSQLVRAAGEGGVICLGENLSVVASEHTSRLHIQINDSEGIYFIRPYAGPRIVAKDLDLEKHHTVKVYFDNKVVESWTLDFSKSNSKTLLLWRSKGAWRTDEVEVNTCINHV